MAESDSDSAFDDSAFDTDHHDLLSAMSTESTDCPPTETLVDYADGRLSDEQARQLSTHLGVCDDCSRELELLEREPTEVDDLTWKRAAARLDRQPVPWLEGQERKRRPGTLLALAASVLTFVAAASFWLSQRQPVSPEAAEVRGASIVAEAPAGTVDDLEAFSWSLSAPIRAVFIVELARGETLLWSGELSSGELPREIVALLEAGAEYRWRVSATSATGSTLAQSSWTGFRLSGSASATASDDEGDDQANEQ